MNGAPAKPMSGTCSSRRSRRIASSTIAELLARLEAAQRRHVGGGAHRRLDDRALALVEVEGDAERRERHEEVGEEDGGVEARTRGSAAA